MQRKFRFTAILVLVVILGAVVLQVAIGQSGRVPNRFLDCALEIELGEAQPAKYEQRLSSGAVYTLLQATGELDRLPTLPRVA